MTQEYQLLNSNSMRCIHTATMKKNFKNILNFFKNGIVSAKNKILLRGDIICKNERNSRFTYQM